MVIVSSNLVSAAEDAEVRLVNLLAQNAASLGSSFQADCSASIAAGDVSSLISSLIGDAGAMQVLTQLPTDQATAAMSILSALLLKSHESKLVVQLADTIVAVTPESPAVAKRKILLLSILSNMLADPTEKCVVLGKLYRVAGPYADVLLQPESSLGSLLSSAAETSAVPRLVTLLDAWKIASADRRLFYRTVAQALPVGDSRTQRFWILLATLADDDDEAARACAVGAIRDPITLYMHQRAMLDIPCVRALEKKDPALWGLLKIFQEGSIADYSQFMQKNPQLLATYELDDAACQRHLRILTLCSLASRATELLHSDIAKALQIEESSVEDWIVAAVGSGLVQVKVDQTKKTVQVQRCAVRRFDQEEWKALRARLQTWKDNVGGVLAAIKESQASLNN